MKTSSAKNFFDHETSVLLNEKFVLYLIGDKHHFLVCKFISCDCSQGLFEIFLAEVLVLIKVLIKERVTIKTGRTNECAQVSKMNMSENLKI